jgi:hypothetical protein
MSQSMRCRPSDLLGVKDSWAAFCTDRATWTLAMTIQSEQDEAERRLPKTAKDTTRDRVRQRVLDEYLGYDSSESGRFRSIGA